MDLPKGYASAFSDKVLFLRVSPFCPTNEHYIISLDLDFTDKKTYTEVPIAKEEHRDPQGWTHRDPHWNVTWQCYGLIKVTVEKESTMKVFYLELL